VETSFELSSEFLEREDVSLTAGDLRYGYDRGWIKAYTVVERATAEVAAGNTEIAMRQIAELLPGDLDRLSRSLRGLDGRDDFYDPRDAARKWLYLELKAAYVLREVLADPLGVVEDIYAEFDYPPSIRSLVRSNPSEGKHTRGIDQLMRRWHEFLFREHAALRRTPPEPDLR
jgi:hypothetical protein